MTATNPILALTFVAFSCTSLREQTMSESSFAIPESDGILLDWSKCTAVKPCLIGTVEEKDFALGFESAPRTLVGLVGGKPVVLELDDGSIFRLGDHAIELQFTDNAKTLQLELVWNELEQRPLDFDLLTLSRVDSD